MSFWSKIEQGLYSYADFMTEEVQEPVVRATNSATAGIRHAAYAYADFMTEEVQEPIIRATNSAAAGVRHAVYSYQETMDEFVASISGRDSGSDLTAWDRFWAAPKVGVLAIFSPLLAVLSLGGCGDDQDQRSGLDKYVEDYRWNDQPLKDCDSLETCEAAFVACQDSCIITEDLKDCDESLEKCGEKAVEEADKVYQGELSDADQRCEAQFDGNPTGITNCKTEAEKGLKAQYEASLEAADALCISNYDTCVETGKSPSCMQFCADFLQVRILEEGISVPADYFENLESIEETPAEK